MVIVHGSPRTRMAATISVPPLIVDAAWDQQPLSGVPTHMDARLPNWRELDIGPIIPATLVSLTGLMRRAVVKDPAGLPRSASAIAMTAHSARSPIDPRRDLVVCSKRVAPRGPTRAVVLGLVLALATLFGFRSMSALTWLVVLVVRGPMGRGTPLPAPRCFHLLRDRRCLDIVPAPMAMSMRMVAMLFVMVRLGAIRIPGRHGRGSLPPSGYTCPTLALAMAASSSATPHLPDSGGKETLRPRSRSQALGLDLAAKFGGGMDILCTRLGR